MPRLAINFRYGSKYETKPFRYRASNIAADERRRRWTLMVTLRGDCAAPATLVRSPTCNAASSGSCQICGQSEGGGGDASASRRRRLMACLWVRGFGAELRHQERNQRQRNNSELRREPANQSAFDCQQGIREFQRGKWHLAAPTFRPDRQAHKPVSSGLRRWCRRCRGRPMAWRRGGILWKDHA